MAWATAENMEIKTTMQAETRKTKGEKERTE